MRTANLDRRGKEIIINKVIPSRYKLNAFLKLFAKSKTYTLKEALDIILSDKAFRKTTISKDRYVELIRDLEKYKRANLSPNVINVSYNLDASNRTRFLLSFLVKQLYRYGHDFMSPKMTRFNRDILNKQINK